LNQPSFTIQMSDLYPHQGIMVLPNKNLFII